MRKILTYIFILIASVSFGQAPIFDWTAGSNRDASSNVLGTNINVPYSVTEKGFTGVFDGGTTTKISYASTGMDFTGNLTIEIFVFSGNNNNEYQTIWDSRDGGNDGIQLMITNSRNFSIRYNSEDLDGSDNIIDNTWYHVIAVIDKVNNLTKLYIDNVINVLTKDITGQSISVAGNTAIGGRIFTTGEGFYGSIAKVRIYDYVLSSQQRNANYAEFLNPVHLNQNIQIKEPKMARDLSRLVDSEVGSDVVTNGDFVNWTGDDPDDWTVTGEDATNYITQSGNAVNIVSDGTFVGILQDFLTIGSKYKLQITVTNRSSGGIILLNTGGLGVIATITAVGTYVYDFTATGVQLQVYRSGVTDLVFANIIATELTGLQFSTNFKPINGQLIDESQLGNNGTIYGAISTMEGMRFDGSSYVIKSSETYLSATGECTFAFRAKLNTTGVSNTILGKSTASSLSLITIASGNLTMETNTNSDFAYAVVTHDNLWHNYVISCDNGTVQMYQDGIALTMTDATVSDDITLDVIGARNTSTSINSPLYGEFQELQIYNKAFTQTEATQWHNQFQTAEKIDLKWASVGDVPSYFRLGTGSYEVSESVVEMGRVAYPLDFTSWNDFGNHPVIVTTNSFTTNDGTSSGLRKNSILTTNKRYGLRIVGTTTSLNLIVRGYGGSSTIIKAYSNETFNDYLTFQEEDGGIAIHHAAANGTTTITNFELFEIPPLDFNKHWKFLTCTGAGTISYPSEQAYGQWEFDVYKGADGNATITIPIASKNGDRNVAGQNGYYTLISTGEAFAFGIINNGSPLTLFTTATSYISNNTWYRIHIDRLSSEGVFPLIPTLQVSDCENSIVPYSSFTTKGRYGFSAASDGSGTAIASTADEVNYVTGEKYLIECNLNLNSGTAPKIQLRPNVGGTPASIAGNLSNGSNSIILTATATITGILQFYTTTATDYTISGLTIKRIYPANTFATFIKGGSFTDWTLVVPSSGDNPCTDATYTTSKNMVWDLDVGDKTRNIKWWDQINVR